LAPPRNRGSALLAFLCGERETVTTLFADMKGSTELMRDVDPEEARAIVDPALKPMIDVALLPDGFHSVSTIVTMK
jgi:class 3 adenylate cyclase